MLWYSNTANTAGSVAVTDEITGNPAFAADGAEAAHPYHLLGSSAAIDRGLDASVTEDIDGQPRPMDGGYDLGADEYAGTGLAVSKRAPSLYVLYGRPLTYTIAVTSAGQSGATGVVVTDTLDGWQQLSAAAASQGACSLIAGWGGGAVCTIGDLASGAAAYVTLTAQISPSITPGQAMANSVDVTADETANSTQTTVYATNCRARLNDGAAEYQLLQDAVDAAEAGDLVKVAGGTCVGLNTRGGLRQVLYLDKQVTIRGGYANDWMSYDPEANPTTLDAQNGGRALYVTGAISPTLEGLRFTGGNAGSLGGASWTGSGGGACVRTAAPTFSNTHFLNNAATRGAGLFLESSGALIQASHFYSNTASLRGGGVYAYQSAATFNHNHLYANTATSTGGGVYLFRSNAAFNANLITANSSDQGGGIYLDEAANPCFTNTVIAGNRANSMAGAVYALASSPKLWHTTVAGNVYTNGVGIYATDYSGTYSSVAMTNTILVSQSVGIQVNTGSAATLNGVLWFNNASGNTAGPVTVQNATEGNPAFDLDGYHITAASQAVNRGVASGVDVDIDGDARPLHGSHDLGADEYNGTVTLDVTGPGIYLLSDRCSSLSFAPGQTGTLATITATFLYAYPTAQGAPRPLPRRYDLQGDGLGFTATLSLCYADADLAAANIPAASEPSLRIYRHIGSGEWISYTSTVYTTTNVVTATIGEFSTWAIGTPVDNHQPTAVSLHSVWAHRSFYPYALVGVLLGAGLLSVLTWRMRRSWRRQRPRQICPQAGTENATML
ncbi:MAG: DUF11 domain-containing protein [Thermoflexales bacterium]|nr:DUF11 domain-containing protein [Thermoflexales bacterium]